MIQTLFAGPCRDAARLLMIVAVLLATVAALPARTAGAAGTEDGSVAVPDVQGARLLVGIATTSNWTRIRIAPGEVVSHKVLGHAEGAQLERLGDGWLLRPAPGAGWAWAQVEVVFAEVTDRRDFAVDITKGFDGWTQLEIENRNGSPYQVLSTANRVQSLTDPSNLASTSLTRDRLLSTTPLALPKADARKLVLAFYYPWFGSYDDPRMMDRPLEPRSTYSYAGVRSMTEQARANGVDGFIVSWAGAANDGYGFDVALDAAEQTAGLATGYLETPRARDKKGKVSNKVVRDWLAELLQRSSSTAFLRSDGVPVVFVWQMEALTPDQWRWVLDQLAKRKQQVRLVGDTTSADYAEVSWGVHRYVPEGTIEQRTRWHQRLALRERSAAVLDDSRTPRLVAGGTSPGFDDGSRVVSREDGERYPATWDAALAGDPDWVTITSWNEWIESSTIEPSTRFGDLALRQTRERAADWRR